MKGWKSWQCWKKRKREADLVANEDGKVVARGRGPDEDVGRAVLGHQRHGLDVAERQIGQRRRRQQQRLFRFRAAGQI